MALHAYYFDTQKQSVLHYLKQFFFLKYVLSECREDRIHGL